MALSFSFRGVVARSLQLMAGGAALTAVAALDPSSAHACGGCFVPPSTSTVVTGHRMVISISKTQTTLWDQIQYSGNPAEFAWVLPIKPGARVEQAKAAFFEVLEATTARQVSAPYVSCGGGGGLGCGALALSGDASEGAPNDEGVTVVHHGTVGPYETVTLSASEPGALNAWLASHGYNVDPSTQPIIDSYVADGFDFIALRLLPNEGTAAMTPVRVVQEGSNPALPLRMVGIGTGADVPVVLYVVGEGRWATDNFPEAKLDSELIAWDFGKSSSNYDLVRKEALAANDGRSWLTAFAQRGTLTDFAPVLPTSAAIDDSYGRTFPQAYADQAFSNGEIDAKCNLIPISQSGVVTNPCPAGEPLDSPDCGTVSGTQIDARQLACGSADDVATALIGMNAGDAWVTRLEADLPHAALDLDLLLAAAKEQTPVARDVQAVIAIHEDKACPNSSTLFPRFHRPGEPSSGFPMSAMMTLLLGGVGLGLASRRLAAARIKR